MAALMMPMFAGAAGVAVDASNMLWAKSRLQAATDSAALAASSGLANEVMTVDDAKRAAKEYLALHMSSGKLEDLQAEVDSDVNASKNATVSIATSSSGVGGGREYVVAVQTYMRVPLNPMTKLLGLSDPIVSARSESRGATATESALSMYLVLDRSGSMSEKTNKGGVNKIQSLKLAVAGLLAQFQKADPSSSYVRTAAVSYNGDMNTPSGFTWDEANTLAYVNKLTASGSTNSGLAMQTAFTQLTDGNETAAHKSKTGITPKTFIVFMTDGDNTAAKNDSDTKVVCDKARIQKTTIYTVAFMAPKKGKALLEYCATTSLNYFEAEDADALVAAFASIGRDASKLAVRLTQ
jgi:Flp pilus assembly protein TadG